MGLSISVIVKFIMQKLYRIQNNYNRCTFTKFITAPGNAKFQRMSEYLAMCPCYYMAHTQNCVGLFANSQLFMYRPIALCLDSNSQVVGLNDACRFCREPTADEKTRKAFRSATDWSCIDLMLHRSGGGDAICFLMQNDHRSTPVPQTCCKKSTIYSWTPQLNLNACCLYIYAL
jgi:hypothetical protein